VVGRQAPAIGEAAVAFRNPEFPTVGGRCDGNRQGAPLVTKGKGPHRPLLPAARRRGERKVDFTISTIQLSASLHLRGRQGVATATFVALALVALLREGAEDCSPTMLTSAGEFEPGQEAAHARHRLRGFDGDVRRSV